MPSDHPPDPRDAPRQRLRALDRALAETHKQLIVSLRGDYEAAGGHVDGPLALLQLVESDPAFAWIAPLTRLLLAVGDGDRAPDARSVEALLDDTDALFQSAAPDDFAARYTERLQRDFDLLSAHRDLRKVLAR